MIRLLLLLSASLIALGFSAQAAETALTLQLLGPDGPGAAIGTVSFSDGAKGLAITPKLSGLPPGLHGFHVHEKPSCDTVDGVPGAGAGGHYDPQKSGKHLGPDHPGGHLGDLPVLGVSVNSAATKPITAPRLKVADLKGRSLVIHGGGDNYADQPRPLGGGGDRIACGVFP